jgi:hypothetical protein
MRADELTRGGWLEFAGGSRPGSRKLSFSEEPDGRIAIRISIVFSWDPFESDTYGFHVERESFQRFLQHLLASGHEFLGVRADTGAVLDELYMEFVLQDKMLSFRFDTSKTVSHSATHSIGIGHHMEEFAQIACDGLEP